MTRNKSSGKIHKRLLATAILYILLCVVSPAHAGAKYIFLFIGDGMGVAQRNAAEMYLSGMRKIQGDKEEREFQLVMNSLPVLGFIRTNSLSGVTDSAAAGTALATGRKVKNGVIAMNPDTGENFISVAEAVHRRGMKVGIVTSAFLQDATPAVFYGHASKRTERYKLGLQLADSGFEYFGGAGFNKPQGNNNKSRDLYGIAESKGYAIVKNLDEFPSLEKVIAIHPKLSGGYMPWVIDKPQSPSLADFVDYGIKRLDGYNGFFIMVEGGKIDLACHANDAAASVHETLAFDEAIARAVAFMESRPESTLIVVTSDHETGGMTLEPSKTTAEVLYRALSPRQGSYSTFEKRISPKKDAKITDYMDMAQKFFGSGVTLTPAIQSAFRLSMMPQNERKTAEPNYAKLYGPYDPFTMACVKEADAQAGITWTSYYHTGKDVPISAAGAGAELFSGEYENTGVRDRILAVLDGY